MIGALSGSPGVGVYSVSAQSRLRAGQEQAGKDGSASNDLKSAPGQLTDEEKRVVAKLKQREAEVLAHEQAHKMAGGAHAGTPSYTTTQGPDGRRYITGGEVSIDVSAENDPESTIRKMEQIKRAAMAPTDPSAQDRAVAQQAEAIKAQAEAELAQQRQEQLRGETEEAGGALTSAPSSSSNDSNALPEGPYNQAAKAYRTTAAIIGALQGVGVSA